MLVCRQLERRQAIATAARNLFVPLFVALRLVRPARARVLSAAARVAAPTERTRRLAQVYYGWGVWRAISWWWTPASAYEPPLADMDGRRLGVAVLHALFFGAYVMQFYWARILMRKAVAELRAKGD